MARHWSDFIKMTDKIEDLKEHVDGGGNLFKVASRRTLYRNDAGLYVVMQKTRRISASASFQEAYAEWKA